MGKTAVLFVLVAVSYCPALGQSTDFPLQSAFYPLLDQYAVRSGAQFFTAMKPYSRRKAADLILNDDYTMSKVQAFNRDYIGVESREHMGDSTLGKARKPLIWKLYDYESDLVSVSNEAFDLHVNPMLHFSYGFDSELDNPLFINTRGIELRGTLDDKVSFYTNIQENQMRLPGYVQAVQDTVGVIPYEGFWKSFNDDAYDFLRAIGYIDVGFTKHLSGQFGFGRHFLGNGERSMILSDFSNSYPYLRLTAEVWKIKYTFMFAEMIADVEFFEGGNLGSRVYPKKFFSFHHLDIAINKNLHIGLFESVLTGRPDSLGGTEFKFQYLNPIIFFGALEQQDGSADNVIVGMDASWNIAKRAQLYGQFVLDELIVSRLTSGEGWWGNKFAYQLGAKYYDFILPTLNLQLEFNQARPFTYGHDGDFTSYTHYRQPLAHPLGANFTELLFKASYQPWPRWTFRTDFLWADYGSGPVNGLSIGRNPFINTNNRGPGESNDFGHRQGQGIKSILTMGQLRMSYMWKHNLFADFHIAARSEDREDRPINNSVFFSLGARWNVALRDYFF
ncbi:MAG: hypothetical protein AAGA85_22300 [Bacteroidota bacterium]